MRIKAKFLLALILSLTLLFGLIPGCAAETTKTTTASPTTAVSTTATTKKAEPFSFSLIGHVQVLVEDNDYQKMMEEKLNVSLKFYPQNPANAEDMNLLLVSGDLPDAMVLTNLGLLKTAASQGLIREVTEEMVRKNAPFYAKAIDEMDPAGWLKASYNGKLYGLQETWCDGALAHYTAVRKDWVTKVGGTVKEVMTLDELTALMQKFVKDDPDGNGKNDTYGTGYRWDIVPFGAFGLSTVILSDGLTKMPDKTVGYAPLLANDFKAALKYFNEWYKSGLLDPEYLTDTPAITNDKFANGKMGIVMGNSSQINYSLSMSGWHPVIALLSTGKKTRDDIFYIKRITGADGRFGSVNYANASGYNVVFKAGLSDEKTAKIMQVFNAANADDETFRLMYHGIEHTHYEWSPQGFVMLTEQNSANVKKLNDDVAFRQMVFAPIHPLYRAIERIGPIYKEIYESGNAPVGIAVYGLPGTPTDLGVQYWADCTKVTKQYATDVIIGNKNLTSDYDVLISELGKLKITELMKEYNDLYKKAYGSK